MQLKNRIHPSILRPAWQLPLLLARAPEQEPVVLMYHGVPANGDGSFIDASIFERHVRFLKERFEIAHPDELHDQRKASSRIRVLLTFDDGFQNNAAVVAPILEKFNAPAIFFVCSRHRQPGTYLWFSYLRALEKCYPERVIRFQGESIPTAQLTKTLLGLTPHPSAMYDAIENDLPPLEQFMDASVIQDRFAGMTDAHVERLAQSSLFKLGVHTTDHPFLSKCSAEESYRQLNDNKVWLEKLSKKPCERVAYPSGDYDERVLRQCAELGLVHGYSVIPKLRSQTQMEVPRLGIYSTSLDVLGFKVIWGHKTRQLGISIG